MSSSNAFSITINPASTAVGYNQVVLVGTNYERDARPAGFSVSNWQQALFDCYGSGSFVPGYGSYGAYATAGTGGHLAVENTECSIFDFADYTWRLALNTNGKRARVATFTVSDLYNGDTTYLELTADGVPAPSHVYSTPVGVGSALWMPRVKYALSTSLDSDYMHRCTLNYSATTPTCTWDRPATNVSSLPQGSGNDVYNQCFHESTNGRNRLWYASIFGKGLKYYDLSGNSWTVAAASDLSGCDSYGNLIYDDINSRIWLRTYSGGLGYVVLGATGVTGWTPAPTPSTLPELASYRWHRWPSADGGDNCFYARSQSQNGTNNLWKFNPNIGGTPIFSTVTINGAGSATMPSMNVMADTVFGSRFFYVPSRKCFAWVAGNNQSVALLRP